MNLRKNAVAANDLTVEGPMDFISNVNENKVFNKVYAGKNSVLDFSQADDIVAPKKNRKINVKEEVAEKIANEVVGEILEKVKHGEPNLYIKELTTEGIANFKNNVKSSATTKIGQLTATKGSSITFSL